MTDFKNCPICDSLLDEDEDMFSNSMYFCLNNCFSYAIIDLGFPNRNSHFFKVFNSDFFVYRDNDSIEYKKSIENEVLELINYWKENDRYLMELMK